MTKLSVNVNKIATLRNARGKDQPHLIEFVRLIVQSGAHGITAHPRPDGRHIRRQDIYDLKKFLSGALDIEYNIEGFPSDSFLNLIKSVQPHQCSLVPDPPDVLTSNAGWRLHANREALTRAVRFLQERGVRAALFVDPHSVTEEDGKALKEISPDRIELYTERYAEAWERRRRLSAKPGPALSPAQWAAGRGKRELFEPGAAPASNEAAAPPPALRQAPPSLPPPPAGGLTGASAEASEEAAEANLHSVVESYRRLAEQAQALSIDVNAGHDLNQDNLGFFLRRVPCVKEVSIGHALIAEALRDGLPKTVSAYLNIIKSDPLK